MSFSIKQKKTSKYIKDNVFDNFDITELLRKDLYIPKIELSNFLYRKDLCNSNLALLSTEDISQDEIISEINNNNRFNIEIEKLILTFKNGYKVPFINLYTPIKLIGQGHFGLVLSVYHVQTKRKMAVKIIKKKKYSDDHYLLETKLLQKLNHERIIKLYDVINTKKYLFIFTELCEGGSLKDFIISRYNSNNNYFMKDSECAIIIKNIIQGVEYLSSNGIIHRDLKPENIMFRKENDINSLVLCDFGLAGEIMRNSFVESKCGTLIFMAPEVIFNRKYDFLVDVWSIGIIMYILESGGKHPIYDKNMASKAFVEFIKNKNKITFPDFFPSIARNFFLKLTKYDPFFRYNVNKALNHPWIIRVNNKIPLTVIEDIEKEDKIKNFKNMLISFTFLKQFKRNLKKKYKNAQNIIAINHKNSESKLNTPKLKNDKYSNYYNNIKEEENLDNILPILQNPLSRKIINKLYSAKPSKSINYLKQIKPNNLFSIEEKRKTLIKLNNLIKEVRNNKSQKNIIIQRNVENDLDINKKNNILIQKYPSLDKRNYFFNLENKGKKIRLLSSKNIKNDDNKILKKLSINSPKIVSDLMTNEKILKSFLKKQQKNI